MRFAALSLSAALVLAPAAAGAQIFKCEGPGGVVEYTNAPPAGPQEGRTCKTVDATITVIPAPIKAPARPTAAPGAAPAAGASAAPAAPRSGTAPESFPKVDPATQRVRDTDRRRILDDELRKEEARLAELRKEFNNGEPERRGDERNYQKYLDRVQNLKDDIQRTEGNLATIRRELGALKN